MKIVSRIDFSAQGWARVVLWTVLGTLGCMTIALYADSFNFATMDPAARDRAILMNIALPVLLASPLLFFFSSKLRELAIAHHQVSILASTDGLTSVLNRRAFTTLVDAYLQAARQQQLEKRGALLVIDADHFKAINDSFGHDRGDEALILIARTIETELRVADIVGRIGGEEFGIFLPGASPDDAIKAAERIRRAIASAEFRPNGRPQALSVSVGGAAFDQEVAFSDLFRIADQRLYDAKRNGRNRIEVARMPDVGVPAMLH